VQQNANPTRRTFARLTFADHVDRFVACDRAPGSPEGTEALADAHSAFDGPVILFQDVIEVLYRSVLAVLLQSSRSDLSCTMAGG
jgi:hypothetical protein